MYDITIQKLHDVDLNELARFTYDVLQSSIFQDNKMTAAGIEESLSEMAEDDNEIMFLARDSENQEILGKLGVYTGFPRMAFISKWDPIVKPSKSKEVMERVLIQRCKRYIKRKKYSRLEALLSPIWEGLEKTRREYQILYEREGFHLSTVEASMEVEMSKWKPPSQTPELPDGCEYVEITNWKNEELIKVIHEIFEISKNRLTHDMTEPERNITYNYWLDRTRPFHSSTVLVLHDKKVIGLCVGRIQNNKVELGPIGLLPEFRGKKIAYALMYESMMKIKQDREMKYAKLEVDITNDSALKLYITFGFSEQYRQEYYAWNTGK